LVAGDEIVIGMRCIAAVALSGGASYGAKGL